MAYPSPTSDADATFCLGCGYALRDLPSNRCPECGREFDPADLKTVSHRRSLRGWQRRLLRPIGWPATLLAVLGTAGLACLSYRPHLQLEPWSILRDELRWPSHIARPFTLPDITYFAAMGLWLALLLSIVIRSLARLAMPNAAQWAIQVSPQSRRCRRVIFIAVILSSFLMVFGWEQRVGHRWMARVDRDRPKTPPTWRAHYMSYRAGLGSPLFDFNNEQTQQILSALITDLPTARGRMLALAEIIECSGRSSLPAVRRAADCEADDELLACEIRIIGLSRDPATEGFLVSRLKHPNPKIREAAADAIGILRCPSYSIFACMPFWIAPPLSLDSAPPILIEEMLRGPIYPNTFGRQFENHDLLDDPPVSIDPAVRDTLEKMMIAGASSAEREAAARALVVWPPSKYRLRVAEWGVWIDAGGNLALPQSILGEIPPCVHQTGNPVESFGDYFRFPSAVTKPVVHLTTDRPLATDVEVHIRQGRPWFAYPLPDDFGVGDAKINDDEPIGFALERVMPLDGQVHDDIMFPSLSDLSNAREGYPWLVPHHRMKNDNGEFFGSGSYVYDLGLRWQSLIISPEKLPWMAPPAISSDPHFTWWPRLRDVPCSWVANRGEAERFLYYDGPTRSAVPVAVRLENGGDTLRFAIKVEKTPEQLGTAREPHGFEPMQVKRPKGLPAHEGLYIDLRGGVLRGQHVVIQSDGAMTLEKDLPLKGVAVVERLREMLLTYGLSGPEAEGLIASWEGQFFHAPGRRFILRMSPEEYARQCPMQVRPAPTEVVRLGLVLTEFDEQKK